MSVQIKICGIRRPEDVAYLNEYRPDYAGFIFWEKSFRYVTPAQAAGLRRRLAPEIPAVGVFVEEAPERIRDCVESGAIQIVQLHGQETAGDISRLRAMLGDVPVWKAYKVRTKEDLRQAARSDADRILLDNGYGTGECFDHSLLADFGREYILAGGLTPEMLPEVIRKYHPAMVDISSGVETDRYKDREKIKKAVQAARES